MGGFHDARLGLLARHAYGALGKPDEIENQVIAPKEFGAGRFVWTIYWGV